MVIRAEGAGASCLYFGHVVHQRLRPVTHRFRYQVCGLLVDLDELSELDRRLALFSWNRPNIFGFYERDHGPRDGSSLKAWLQQHLSRIGVGVSPGPVRMLCFPRLFGYVFNPLTVWFCYQPGGGVAALVLEVSNIAHQSHSYVLSVDGHSSEGWICADFAKRFPVSGFIGMDARYRCRVLAPGDRMCVSVREFEHGDETLTAAWHGHRIPLTDASLLYALGRFPLMTVKISAAIYWQALRLISKRVPLSPQDAASNLELTYAGVAQREHQADGSSGSAVALWTSR
jgi:uncharacterized protein